MKLLITLLLLLCHNCVRSLPVQSQALENVDDQFFWQQAWFSSNDKPDSPFTGGDSKKITAKSIFITPNLVKPSHYCPPGYLIDDNGKCIKIVSIKQESEELLTSRLINLIATHDFDYDYDEGEQTSDEQLKDLPPLVQILNENSEEDVKSQSVVTTTTENLKFFLCDDKKDDVEIVITTLSNDNETVSYEHATLGSENENVTESSQNSLKDLMKSDENSTESSSESLIESSSKSSSLFESLPESSSESPKEKLPESLPETLSENHREKSNESSDESLLKISPESSTQNSLKIIKNTFESSSEELNQNAAQKVSSEELLKVSDSQIEKDFKNNSDENNKQISESSSTKPNPGNSQFIREIPQTSTEGSNLNENVSSSSQKVQISESTEGSFESSVMTLEKILYGQFESFLKETEAKKNSTNIEEKAQENSKSAQSSESSNSELQHSTEKVEPSTEDPNLKYPKILSQIINEELLENSSPKSSPEAFNQNQPEAFKPTSQNPFKSTEPLIITTASSFDTEIYEQSTDVAISESSDTINFDADNAFLLNDSLIIVDDKNNSSDVDYSDVITTIEPFSESKEEEENSSGASRNSDVPTTPQDDLDKALEIDRQNENKFVYHHLTEPTTTTTMPALSTTTEFANKLLRFPSDTLNDEEQQRHRVRFPDDDEEIITTARQTPRPTSFSWPKESNTQRSGSGVPNKLHITRFWNTQPFISDHSPRGNSKSFRSENFLPYTRKVILTPQRYNYRK